jgi:hypothetical protein
MDTAKTDVIRPIAYGRMCRKVFGWKTWEQASVPIREIWETIPAALPWDVAVARISEGWKLGSPVSRGSGPLARWGSLYGVRTGHF